MTSVKLAAAGKQQLAAKALLGIILCFLLCLFAPVASAYDAQVVWSQVAGATGYKLYVRESSQLYVTGIDVGSPAPDLDGNIQYIKTGLVMGVTYYFAVTAYDGSEVESRYSNRLCLDDNGYPSLCVIEGQLPDVDYSGSDGREDSSSVNCQKRVGDEVKRFRRKKFALLRRCLDQIQEHKARLEAGLSLSGIAKARNAAVKSCTEARASDRDTKTMFGKIHTARAKAVSAIQKACGRPGDVTLDGRRIRSTASDDFTHSQVEKHLEYVGCTVEALIAAAYPGAAADLAAFTARPSQDPDHTSIAKPLDTLFPCLEQLAVRRLLRGWSTGQADLPPLDYSPVDGEKDSRSVACQKEVGAIVTSFGDKKYNLMRHCLDAVQEYKALVAAWMVAAPMWAQQIEQTLATATKKCVEPSSRAGDEKTMLGRIAAERTKAIRRIQRRCGSHGGTTVDGKPIPSSASEDLSRSEIEAHLDRVGCVTEELIALGYPGAKTDLSEFNARPSQDPAGTNTAKPLDTLFPCLEP